MHFSLNQMADFLKAGLLFLKCLPITFIRRRYSTDRLTKKNAFQIYMAECLCDQNGSCVYLRLSVRLHYSSISAFLFSQKKEVANESTGRGVPFSSEIQQTYDWNDYVIFPCIWVVSPEKALFKEKWRTQRKYSALLHCSPQVRFISPVIDLLVLCLLEILCHV